MTIRSIVTAAIYAVLVFVVFIGGVMVSKCAIAGMYY
jgi:hypothetical protein